MIVGIGIDIVQISRMSRWRAKETLLARYFHPNELAAARRRGETFDHSLAARFAAKEALGKAFGTGMAGLRLREIEVINDSNGKPSMRLYGTSRAIFEASGGEKLFLSLTHESDNAIALVVIEGA